MSRRTQRIETEAEIPSTIEDVQLGDMGIPEYAQRVLRPHWVDEMAANFRLDDIGVFHVNFRDGTYWVLDGQHRRAALIKWLGEGWEGSTVRCVVYKGLTEAQEAAKFLALNKTLRVNSFEKFKKAVKAGHQEEVHIQKIVESQGLHVSQDREISGGCISAVAALRKVYRMGGPQVLGKALRIIRDSFGDAGLESKVVEGIGILCHRYPDEILDERLAIMKLSKINGGVFGLKGAAAALRKATGNALGFCIAAACVDYINKGQKGRKLPSFWAEAR